MPRELILVDSIGTDRAIQIAGVEGGTLCFLADLAGGLKAYDLILNNITLLASINPVGACVSVWMDPVNNNIIHSTWRTGGSNSYVRAHLYDASGPAFVELDSVFINGQANKHWVNPEDRRLWVGTITTNRLRVFDFDGSSYNLLDTYTMPFAGERTCNGGGNHCFEVSGNVVRAFRYEGGAIVYVAVLNPGMGVLDSCYYKDGYIWISSQTLGRTGIATFNGAVFSLINVYFPGGVSSGRGIFVDAVFAYQARTVSDVGWFELVNDVIVEVNTVAGSAYFNIWGTYDTFIWFANDGAGLVVYEFDLVAEFRGTPLCGFNNLFVQFMNDTIYSGGDIPTFLWSFGDGESSTEVAPLHEYKYPGSFDVELRATNLAGTDAVSKNDYVEVLALFGERISNNSLYWPSDVIHVNQDYWVIAVEDKERSLIGTDVIIVRYVDPEGITGSLTGCHLSDNAVVTYVSAGLNSKVGKWRFKLYAVLPGGAILEGVEFFTNVEPPL